MWDELVYQNAVRQIVGFVVHSNTLATERWVGMRDQWLQDAEWKRGLGRTDFLPKPDPPALQLWVEAPPWSPGITESAIVVHVGPNRVADPTCELPPLPPDNPPGVVDVGVHNWGAIWAAGPKDTMHEGAIVEHQGRRLKRVGLRGLFGGRGYYEEVS